MSHRIKKINELIKQQISEIITREINFKPGVFATISRVDTSSDLRYTRVFVSVFPEKESVYVFKTLENKIYHLQGFLNKKLSMKPLPRVKFFPDDTEIKTDEIEKILKNIS